MAGVGVAALVLGCAHLPRAALEQGCAEGLPYRCWQLTRQLLAQHEDRAAVPWLARACELGDQHSCLWHAGMYEWGRGVEQDRGRARALYDASCRRGFQDACSWRDRIDAQDAASVCKPLPGDGLDRQEIKAVIDLQQEPVRYCYEIVLSEESAPEVDVSLSWVIGSDGRVSAATITKDTQPALGVGACVRDQVLRWRFPCPHGGGVVNVTFPWLFRPK